jgi:hypothetical protein
VIYRVEGRLTGEGAEYLRTLATQCHTELKLVVDVTEIMFIDVPGENALLFLKRLGTQFIAETSYSRHVCERLDLPLVRDNLERALLNRTKNGRHQRSILAGGQPIH